MKKIKTKLVAVFLFVIVLMLISNAIFIMVHFKILREYKKITDNMFLEYSLMEAAIDLTQSHYLLIKNIDDKELLSKYNGIRREIRIFISKLDKSIAYSESKIIYRGVKNIIQKIQKDCTDSLRDTLNGNIQKGLEIYAELAYKSSYVKENVASLILKELEYANILQGRFQKTHILILISGFILLIFITFGCIIFAFVFSKKLTNPLVRLSNLAEEVTKGNLGVEVQRDLLDRKDEIGSLTVSFNTMVVNLEKNITELNKSNEQLLKIKKDLEEKNEELIKEVDMRKRSEEALHDSEERFSQVATSSGDWIWEVDSEGRYTYSSPVVEKILGYRSEEVLGKCFYDFFHPDEREKLKKAALEVFSRREIFRSLLNRNMHKDGHAVILETTAAPLISSEGKLLGYRGVDRDITDRKKADEQQKLLLKDLEDMNKIMVGRELKMIELKNEVNRLSKELRRPEPYGQVPSE